LTIGCRKGSLIAMNQRPIIARADAFPPLRGVEPTPNGRLRI
jgi:hypothetical protein